MASITAPCRRIQEAIGSRVSPVTAATTEMAQAAEELCSGQRCVGP